MDLFVIMQYVALWLIKHTRYANIKRTNIRITEFVIYNNNLKGVKKCIMN